LIASPNRSLSERRTPSVAVSQSVGLAWACSQTALRSASATSGRGFGLAADGLAVRKDAVSVSAPPTICSRSVASNTLCHSMRSLRPRAVKVSGRPSAGLRLSRSVVVRLATMRLRQRPPRLLVSTLSAVMSSSVAERSGVSASAKVGAGKPSIPTSESAHQTCAPNASASETA